jgi:hypothetical protein
MITLVLASMVGVFTVVHPFLQEQQSWNNAQINQKFAEYLLLEPGTPADWGSNFESSIIHFGLAKQGFLTPFELDIDKVSRLNSENAYNVSFWDALTALGTTDKPFRIRIEPVFDVYVNLTSKQERLADTVYRFQVTTKKSSLPVAASLSCYAVLLNQVAGNTSSTSPSGEALVEISLPNDGNGTALFIAIAKINPRTVSFVVYPFTHQFIGNPNTHKSYATLSPIDCVLKVDLVSALNKVSNGTIFTYDRWSRLDEINESLTTQYYNIPRLLDIGPMSLVGTGLDGATCFAEWTVYPQVPIDFGSNLSNQYDRSDFHSYRYLVTINSAIYECEVTVGGT